MVEAQNQNICLKESKGKIPQGKPHPPLTTRISRRIRQAQGDRLYRKHSLEAIPTQLGLCMSNLCNIKCVYCMREKYKPPQGMIDR
jgi:sulfatase maturation enzyme AslB (radical SAM superfamily)